MKKEIIGILLIGIVSIFSAGCVDTGHNTIVPPPPAPTPTPTPTWVPSTQISIPEGKDNGIFETLMTEMKFDIGRKSVILGDALTEGRIRDANQAAKNLRSMADVYIEDIGLCEVSGELVTVKGLVLQGLEQTKLAAQSCQKALKTGKSSDAQTTIDQIESATLCFTAAELVYANMED